MFLYYFGIRTFVLDDCTNACSNIMSSLDVWRQYFNNNDNYISTFTNILHKGQRQKEKEK